MASKKELVEAQTFGRRRLLTAFVSGSPGGREIEPQKPMRAVVAGVALSVLLVLGSLGYGLLKPGLPTGWDNNKLVLTKGSGARFVSIKGTLYPVLNTTSARLVIPSESFEVVEVAESKISDVPRGKQIGITGAPDELPSPAHLVGSGWLACVGDDGASRIQITQAPAGEATTDSAVVTVADQTYVVNGSYRYLVPKKDVTAVLRALQLESAPVRAVTGPWLNVFTPGDDLAPLFLPTAGDPLVTSTLPSGTVVGSVVEQTGSGTEARRYVVTAAGELAPLTEIGYQLYQLGSGAQLGAPIQVSSADIRDVRTAPELAPPTWPQAPAAAFDGLDPMCAVLQVPPGSAPGAQPVAHFALAATTTTDALPTTGRAEVEVDAGKGALVRATGDQLTDQGTVAIIDQSGTVFAVPDPSTEVLAQLGYTAADISPVPQSWLAFLPAGPELTVAAASMAPAGTSGS
ncbi:type VII secretion protein EccB [Sanguibacter gelidistatuariae]|uniref:Type VII secretion protein EccB n=1 Tax=Sanguibacter gelidistatuariae TaxID=1814289 RepID=A0A1G6S118_9MICO|nr:type VII secretion protein EccB [Sanguibacter gelidistatuariae]SDD09885.1 type VII secretion protein EccB [Sanguibacter gelidistatuariae]